jgi:hypothetical protein
MQQIRRAVDFVDRLGIAEEVEAIGIIVEAVARAEEQAVMAVREANDAAAAKPAASIEGDAGRVLEAARGADIVEIDAVGRRGDTDGDDIGVRFSRLANDVVVRAKLGVIGQVCSGVSTGVSGAPPSCFAT